MSKIFISWKDDQKLVLSLRKSSTKILMYGRCQILEPDTLKKTKTNIEESIQQYLY